MPRWCTLIWLLWLTSAFPSAVLAQPGEGVVSAGWKTHQPSYAAPATYPAGAGVATPLASGPGRTIFEELPDDTGWLYEDTPLERMLKNTFRHSYFHVDYLLWDISDPGNNVLSAPTNFPTIEYPPDLVRDPINPTGPLIAPSVFSSGPGRTLTAAQAQLFTLDGGSERGRLPPVYQVTSPALLADPAEVPPVLIVTQPTTRDVFTNENNGIRGTFGVVLPVGTFEGRVFALQSSNAKFGPTPVKFLDFADIDDFDPSGGALSGDGVIGDGNLTEYLSTFEGVAQAILIDGHVPTVPSGVVPLVPTPVPLGTPDDPPLNQPLARGDNLRIIWAVRDRDPTSTTFGQLVSSYRDPLTGDIVRAYQASLKTQVWGAEGNYFASAWDPGSPLQLQPMLGFRYLNFQEELRQYGQYTFSSINPVTNQIVETDVPRRIDSTTNNNLYGPQVGFRAEMANKWFAVGATPKVMLGLNSYKADLQTANILRPDDRDQSLAENNQTFGVASDLEVYSRLNVTSHLSLFVSYNFLWTGMLTRPSDNIVYNARSILPAAVPPLPDPVPVSENDLESDFMLDVKYSGAILQGISIGGEIRY